MAGRTVLTMVILALAVAAVSSCRKVYPPQPVPEEICPQPPVRWPSLADSPWPIVRADPQGTNRSRGIGPRKGRVAWVYEVFAVDESGVVIGEDGTVYFTGWSPEGHFLFALSPNGVLKWKTPVGGRTPIFSPIALGNGMLAILALNGYLYLLSSDGTLVRSPRSGAENVAFGAVVGTDGTYYCASYPGVYYAVWPDGSVRWVNASRSDSSHYLPPPYYLTLSPAGDRLYAVTLHRTLTCFDAGSGEILWEAMLPTYGGASAPAVDAQGNVYVVHFAEDQQVHLHCYGPDGNLRWRSNRPVARNQEIHISWQGDILVYAGNDTLVAFDCTGRIKWTAPLVTGGPSRQEGALVGDSESWVYVSYDLKYVVALDAEGNRKFVCELPDVLGGIHAAAVDEQGHLYLVGKYRVYCVE